MKNAPFVKKSIKDKESIYSQKRLNGFLHVWYEMYWYFKLRDEFLNSEYLHIPTFESFLLHIRNLKDFFERTKRNISRSRKKIIKKAMPDDIISEDYGYPAKRIPLGTKFRQRLNKELAHISYKRNKANAKSAVWLIYQDIKNLNSRCEEFIEYMKRNYSSSLDFVILDNMWELSKYVKK